MSVKNEGEKIVIFRKVGKFQTGVIDKLKFIASICVILLEST